MTLLHLDRPVIINLIHTACESFPHCAVTFLASFFFLWVWASLSHNLRNVQLCGKSPREALGSPVDRTHVNYRINTHTHTQTRKMGAA